MPDAPALLPSASFRYCPRCGQGPVAPLEAPLFSCPACRFHYHFNPAVAAGVIAEDARGAPAARPAGEGAGARPPRRPRRLRGHRRERRGLGAARGPRGDRRRGRGPPLPRELAEPLRVERASPTRSWTSTSPGAAATDRGGLARATRSKRCCGCGPTRSTRPRWRSPRRGRRSPASRPSESRSPRSDSRRRRNDDSGPPGRLRPSGLSARPTAHGREDASPAR